MSLDVYLEVVRPVKIYNGNITHNLINMADAAGIYECLWRPEEVGITKAEQLIEPLKTGLAKLKADPDHYKTFDSPSGWGRYEDFVRFVEEYLDACGENPEAEVSVLR